MSNGKNLRNTAALVSVAILMAGCAAPRNSGTGQINSNPSTSEEPCSVGKSAAAGALAGALLGALVGGKDGAAKGAVLGGAAGALACVGINVQSQQTKTAAQAEQEYRRTRGTLPSEPVVVSYSLSTATPTVSRGQQLKVNSSLELVNGTNRPIQTVREELVIVNPDGVELLKNPGSKEFSATTGGGYQNSFSVSIPAGNSQGVYGVKTNLYVNGKIAGTRDLRTQIVWDGSTSTIFASR